MAKRDILIWGYRQVRGKVILSNVDSHIGNANLVLMTICDLVLMHEN